jgi:hypothetical protein
MPFVVDELTRAKLCLLYLFRAVSLPLSRDAVILALDVLPWINQFILSEALSDLLESGLVLETHGQNRNVFEISPSGLSTLSHFEKEIPLSMRQDLDGVRDSIRLLARKESEYITDYHKIGEDRYLAQLAIVENGRTIFRVEIELASSAQADVVCKSWQNTASAAYSAILSSILSH